MEKTEFDLQKFFKERGVDIWTTWQKDPAQLKRRERHLKIVTWAVAILALATVVLGFILGREERFWPVLILALTKLLVDVIILFWVAKQPKNIARQREEYTRRVGSKTPVAVITVTVGSLPDQVVLLARTDGEQLLAEIVPQEAVARTLEDLFVFRGRRDVYIVIGLREEAVVDFRQFFEERRFFAQLANDVGGKLVLPPATFWTQLEEASRVRQH